MIKMSEHRVLIYLNNGFWGGRYLISNGLRKVQALQNTIGQAIDCFSG